MRYAVRLAIDYDYGSPVGAADHCLRLRPISRRNQIVASSNLTVSPQPDDEAGRTDYFGNAVSFIHVDQPHETLSILLTTEVEVSPPVSDLDLSPSVDDLVKALGRSRSFAPTSPVHHLGDSRWVKRSDALTAYADETLRIAGGASIFSAALALAKRIQSDFAYAPGETDIDTSPEEAFAMRSGVCQDFAHIMIAGCRGAGVPAAYVSGFIRTEPPPGQPRLEGADAMHAWVDIWCGDALGWVGFDPTNGCVAGVDHIIVAVGRDYADVSPIDGVILTSGQETHTMAVDVLPIGS
jgi:transglutaminase-like putative cysteine protease